MGISIGSGPKVSVTGNLTPAQRREKEKQYGSASGVKKNDSVNVYCLPKEKRGKLCGFSYTNMTARAERLRRTAYRLQGKITRLRSSPMDPKEREQKLRRLRCQLYYVDRQLGAEMMNAPRTHVIVDEI